MPTLDGEIRKGGVRVRQGEGGRLVFEMDRYYRVYADSETQSEVAIAACPGLPQVNVTMIDGMACTGKTGQRDPMKATLWEFTCTFSSEVREGTDPSTPQQGDPTTWIPVCDCELEPYEEVVRKDADGKAWVNSANKPFESGLVVPRRLASFTFTQFESASGLTIKDIVERSDTTNSVAYGGYPVRSLLLQINRATIGLFYGVRCWKIEYKISYKNKAALPAQAGTGGWTIHQLDAGYQYYDSGDLKSFLDDGDPKSPFIGLLDGNGEALADQQNDTPVFLPFQAYDSIDFNSFLRVLI